MLGSLDCKEEIENNFQKTETAVDEIGWSKFDRGSIPGRLPSACIFKGVKGLRSYSKKTLNQ